MGFLLLVNMAGKTSWLEQMFAALSADEKIYSVNYATGFLNLWNQQEEPLTQNFIFFWVKRMVYPRFPIRNIYSIFNFNHGNICSIEVFFFPCVGIGPTSGENTVGQKYWSKSELFMVNVNCGYRLGFMKYFVAIMLAR